MLVKTFTNYEEAFAYYVEANEKVLGGATMKTLVPGQKWEVTVYSF